MQTAEGSEELEKCEKYHVIDVAKDFKDSDYDCIEMGPSQTFVDLINEDPFFEASGPTYPYNFMREYLHIDAIGQQQMGFLEYLTAINIIRGNGNYSKFNSKSIKKDASASFFN